MINGRNNMPCVRKLWYFDLTASEDTCQCYEQRNADSKQSELSISAKNRAKQVIDTKIGVVYRLKLQKGATKYNSENIHERFQDWFKAIKLILLTQSTPSLNVLAYSVLCSESRLRSSSNKITHKAVQVLRLIIVSLILIT